MPHLEDGVQAKVPRVGAKAVVHVVPIDEIMKSKFQERGGNSTMTCFETPGGRMPPQRSPLRYGALRTAACALRFNAGSAASIPY